jgi:hypothetical protein
LRTVHSPGECVSVDQLESPLPGFIAQLKGRLTRKQYRAATIFVDHYSRLSYIHLQEGLTSKETVDAKHAFEAYARSFGLRIRHYHADNGRFADNAFLKDVTLQGQTISYCGVNAHFQNGIAEKMIRDLQESARKQLLHAKSRWPKAVELNLWPYALRLANHLRNSLPDREDATSPVERFSRVEVAPHLRENHPFGCPVYALNNRLQSGNRIPKWDSRARLGVYLGPSPRHASSVSLVLSLETGLVSPQFHVRHDDFFETVRPTSQNPSTLSHWQSLAGFKEDKLLQASEGATLDKVHHPVIPPMESTQDRFSEPSTSIENLEPPNDQVDVSHDTENNDIVHTETTTLNQDQQQSVQQTRTRVIRRPERLIEVAYSSYYEALHEDDYKLQDDMSDPIAFLSHHSDPDTMYFHEAVKQPDREEFIKAIIKEINDHIDRNHWVLVPRNKVPKGTKILASVWAMKRKRDLVTRQIHKHKARLNVHGGQQQYGINYFETYSPVVTWFSLRTLLTLALLNNWHTQQIDFVQAYTQAPIEFDMYMELPKGIEMKDGNRKTHVLKLLKNLYGQKQAGRVWNQHLVAGLCKIGFQQSEVDECVFYRNKTIFVVYVDDGIFAGPDESEIKQAIKDFRKVGFDIEDKGNIKDYLGVNVTKLPDGRLKLWQPHLIRQIIQDVNLSIKTIRSTPALASKILQRDEKAPSYKGSFHYRSVIGKLNFLEKSTRPDIAYAVHQCARFCEDPKQVHYEAILHLTKYLVGTMDKGIILDPKSEQSFEVYADADFAGNWNKLTAHKDPSTAKSRSGYVILYAGCPIIWSSKLQTQIALSTTEAEYISLSQSLRETIPLMQLLKEFKDRGFAVVSTKPKVHCKAFEDNSGALELARLPKLRPRTKHINVVYHHFRDFVRKGLIEICPISSSEQIGDLLTKPLSQNTFLYLRKKLLHW